MRAIVVANGPTPEYPVAFQRRNEDWIIAADGGTMTALRWGWLPHDVIGDLDSLPGELQDRLEAAGCRFTAFSRRKDWTDLELALQHAVQGGATEIVVLGARGGRLDQELANVLLLGRAEWADVPIRLLDGAEEACVIRRDCTIDGQVGDTVSLIALTPLVEGVSTMGLEWTLDDSALAFGSTLGISNVLSEPPAFVRVREGVLLVVHSRRDPRERKQQAGDARLSAVGEDVGCAKPFTAGGIRKED